MVSVADYGAPIWWKSRCSLAPLQAIQSKAARRILGVFRTTLNAPTELEAALLPLAIRVKRQVALYGVRVRNLPFNNQTAKALRNTTIPTSLIPLSSGYEVAVPKVKTRLQAVQLRNLNLIHGTHKVQIQGATERAWKQHYEKARAKTTPHHSQSYFTRFSFEATKGTDLVRGKRSLTSAFYSLKLGHGYFRSYLHRLNKVNHFRCRCGNKETPEHLLLSCPLY